MVCYSIEIRVPIAGHYAYFGIKESMDYILQYVMPIEEAANIVDTGKDFAVFGITLGLPKHSIYKNLINHVYVNVFLDRCAEYWCVEYTCNYIFISYNLVH